MEIIQWILIILLLFHNHDSANKEKGEEK